MHSNFRQLLISIAILVLGVYTVIWSNAQNKEIEKLQLLNRVTNEELQMAQQRVKEQEAELRKKDKEIAHLESQPK